MAKTNSKISNSVGVQFQPEARLIDNAPASSLAKALANSKAQVSKAK
jgi:hypothetical protein